MSRVRRTGVLVVGASAAGLATVEALRRDGYRDPITLLGAEPHLPYDRPPLSKQILSRTWRPERTLLRAPRLLADLEIDLVLGNPALALDSATRTVATATGPITAEHIVIATGARPRTLPGAIEPAGVHVLRTLDDALALRDGLTRARRVVVVGEGVLGAEIAATARRLGHEVTMTGLQHAPMANQLGDLAAGKLAELHTDNGVRLRLGAGVRNLTARNGAVTGVVLDSAGGAETVPADLVVIAIGAAPVTDWLVGSGLRLDRGVVCDARCRAAENIWAAGDVTRWHHPAVGGGCHLENRTNATTQAQLVAANILGADRAYQPVPYFWTDQYDTKVQVHGIIPPDARAVVVEGDPAAGRFVARFDRADGAPVAVLGWNMPKQVAAHRRSLIGTFEVHAPAYAP
ncbi:NAD(P)/FAD-dependent oxidoreductase [Nocardia sp. NPDC003482]